MKKILIILSLIIFAYLNCNSQTWIRASGMSEAILSLAVKENTIYALVDKEGLFSSSDSGKNWINNGFGYKMDLPYRSFDNNSRVVVSGNIIYVGLQYTGLFFSSDDGINWNEINLPNKKLSQFDIYKNNFVINTDSGLFISKDKGIEWVKTNFSDYEYVSSLRIIDSVIYVGRGNRIHISTNYGKTWGGNLEGINCYGIISLAVNGDTIYAGTQSSGIFKSIDNGQNWSQINNGLTYLKVCSIILDGNNIFAGTDGKALFISSNGGQQWRRMNNDYPDEYYDITSIAVLGNYIFAGGGNFITYRYNGEILYSPDYGENWGIISNGVVGHVDFLLSDKSNVLASTDHGLYLSTNHGLSWSFITQDFNEKDDNSERVSAINSVGDKLFVGIRYRGIYSSTNNGISWEVQSNGLPEFALINTLAVKDSIIFAGMEYDGLYMSSDVGKSWYYVPNGFPLSRIYCLSADDSLVITGTSDGIIMSRDNGLNWSQKGKEIYSQHVYSCLINDNTIYAGTENNLMLISTDLGESWTQKNIGDSPVTSFTVCGNTVYAGTNGAGVFYSTNNGKMWIQKLKGLKSYYINSLLTIGDTVIAVGGAMYFTTNSTDNWTTNDTVIYNGSYEANPICYFNKEIYIGGYGGVFKSSDFGKTYIKSDSGLYSKKYEGFYNHVTIEDSNIIIIDENYNFFHTSNLGKNWSLVNGEMKEYVRTLELQNNVLYACTKKGFFKSSDFGHTWIKSDIGLVDTLLGTFSYDKGRILIRSAGKFYISFDYAESWNQLSDFPSNFSISDFELSDNYIIVSSSWGEGIILSSDLGQTWIYGSVNPLYTLLINDIEAKDNKVFAGCDQDGMFFSSNYGKNWIEVNSSIMLHESYEDISIEAMTLSDDNNMYVHPCSDGIYRLNIDDITGINEGPINENETFSLFPNPSSDYIFIKYREITSNQNIKIYDILGNTVWQGIMKGEYIRIDVSSFSAGVYYLNINGCTRMFVRN